jgi:tRNA A-37 threonylcarbamoyl transferase component Bud32/dipeptidyl aminopeptidase/acylaminoacyl peptidase
MALSAGTCLGPYEILAPIGAGGMGEVFKARDTRLDRIVAIKVTNEQFSERFEGEARAVAALNHPHICHLYDVGPNYFVMEYLDGQQLKGPLSFDQALKYGVQICEALDAAHKKGIVHRDLKPANVLVTKSGVKLLDFGLAKRQPHSNDSSSDVTRKLTQENTIVGTMHYMSPEQLQGKDADARSDIFAFGCVLYEMLTGKHAFEGKDAASVISAVMNADPPAIRSVASVTPPALERVVRKCLAKDPDARWQSVRDLRDDLVWIGNDGVPDPTVAVRPATSLTWAWIVGALAVALGVALWAPWRPERPAAEPVRFQIPLPEKTDQKSVTFEVSPDGRRLAFLAPGSDGVVRHGVRALDSLELRELPGSESRVISPFFWSPDSRFIAYDAGGKLEKIDVAGGPPQTLCDLPGIGIGGSWNRDGVILVAIDGRELVRVSAAGGTPSPVTALDSAHRGTGHFNPLFLPDRRHFLYSAETDWKSASASVFVGSLDVKPGEQSTKQLLVMSGENLAYVSSGDSVLGRLLFVREKTLMAQAFDARRLELVGDPAPVAEHADAFSVSENGVLVYTTGGGQNFQLTWLDRLGTTQRTVGEAGAYNNVVLSPDATQALVSKIGDRGSDLWLMDLTRGGSIRLTFDGVSSIAVWSPDGTRITYPSPRTGAFDLFQKAVSGTKDEELLLKSNDFKAPTSWSRDGRFLLYSVLDDPKTKNDVWVLPLEGRKPTRLLGTEFDEENGQFSPDGKRIAYDSDESGRSEVYVRPFSAGAGGGPPSVGSRALVSKGGGIGPFWREDGKELYYHAPDQTLMAVEVSNNQVFSFGEPKPLYKWPKAPGAIAGDGKRFLVALPVAQSAPQQFTVVLNWQAGLKK